MPSFLVTPFIPLDLTSFVHESLAGLVTLLEKFDALHRRFPNEKAEPATFIRHYEDATRIISAEARLPLLKDYADSKALAAEMLAQKQIAVLPDSSNPAFAPDDGPRWAYLRRAHAAIGQMFWGSRVSLDDACATIPAWAKATFK